MNEASTSRIYVDPKLRATGWETPPHSVASQPVIAPGRIVSQGKEARQLEAELNALLLALQDKAFRGKS
jgi:hypothetical protein